MTKSTKLTKSTKEEVWEELHPPDLLKRGAPLDMRMDAWHLTLRDILEARERIHPYILHTPLIEARALSERTQASIWLKLENLQHTGSFKARGAVFRMLLLSEAERRGGVVAASAGNHAQGVAYAGQRLSISAKVVVPEGTPRTKMDGIRRYGADLVVAGAHYDASEAIAQQMARDTGRTLIHAFEDPWVVAGQGTALLEALWDHPGFDRVIVPMGGGGLIGGTAVVAKAVSPQIQVVGVQSEASPPWYHAFKTGRIVDVSYGPTLAEGLAGGIGQANFDLIKPLVDQVVLVTESQIADAMRDLARHQHLLVEGSAAVGWAALNSGAIPVSPGEQVLLMITGGNVDVETFLTLYNPGGSS